MSPFLSSIARAVPHILVGSTFVGGLVGGYVGLDLLSSLYLILMATTELALFVGGARGVVAENAHRCQVPDAALRADRRDLGLGLFFLGSMLGLVAGFESQPQGGEVLAAVGGLLGYWLVTSSPFSLVLILGVQAWVLVMGALALGVHQQPWGGLLPLQAASLALLVAAGLARGLVRVSGPPSWLRTFLTLGCVVLSPLALGLLGQPHEFRSGHDGPYDSLLGGLVLVAALLSYQWLCLARPDSQGQPAEPTQGGCGCSFMGVGLLIVALDRLGSGLLPILPQGWRVGLLVLVGLASGWAALVASRRARERYRVRS